MIINKIYIDENYEYVKDCYTELVDNSITHISITGNTTEELRLDLISLNHYKFIMEEFAKYYANLIDSVTGYIYTKLAAYDLGVLNYLVSSDGYSLLGFRASYEETYKGTITDKYLRLGYGIYSTLDINTNIDQLGFSLLESVDITSSTVYQDELIDDLLTVDIIKADSFVEAVKNANAIVYKYSTLRYDR